jgi:hypothetical protein
MATSYARTVLPADIWTDVTGALAGTAGVTWQNVSAYDLMVSFGNASAPAAGEGQVLRPGGAYYDRNGSSKIWARAMGPAGAIAATQD